jgi:pimeloyl-ACP methyl ester carboxylesterase
MEDKMETRFLKVDKGTIAYEETGRGPLVICSPSLGDLRQEYRFLVPQLVNAGYRVVTMDVRGHGESSMDGDDFTVAGVGRDLLALIRSLNAGPAIIVGTSMSAGAAVWAAVESPEWVSALVLIGPAVRGELSRSQSILFGVLFTRPWGPALWQMYYKSLYPTRKPEDLTEYTAALKTNLSEKGRMNVLNQMIRAPKTASEERLSKVTVPALVVMGSKDPDFKDPEAEARLVADSLKAEYRMVPDAGHYPHVEMPDLTGPMIVSFVERLIREPADAA